MGLFDLFSTRYSFIEEQLLETYTQIYIGLGYPGNIAKEMSKQMIDNCIKESKSEGTYNLPPNTGDLLLEKEKVSPEIKEKFAVSRKEGVTDDDIRWWWNLNDIERRIMTAVDDVTKLAAFTKLREEGKSIEEASANTRKYHPIYGNPEDTSNTTGDDRPLLPELKDRVNIYIEKRVKRDVESYKKDIEDSTTFNALVRREIRTNNI